MNRMPRPGILLVLLFALICTGCAGERISSTSVPVGDIEVIIEFPAVPLGRSPVHHAVVSDQLNARLDLADPHDGRILGQLNDSEVGEVISAEPIADTISNLLRYSEECYGAFDPTVQILWDVYEFDSGGRRVQNEEIIDALQWVNRDLVEMDGTCIFRKGEHVRVGFGPTLPGAIVDWTLEVAERTGMVDFLVRAGQCMAVVGEMDDEARVYEFMYPLDKPAEDNPQLTMGYIRLAPGEYLAAMDDDEKFFFAGGNRYHMILNPITGRPTDDLRAAIVVSRESCLQAAVFACAVMVMGEERGPEFLDETEGVEGLVLTADHEVIVSSGLGDRFWR